MIDPEVPEEPGILQQLRDRIESLLSMATGPILGTSAASAWLRLILLTVGMLVAYFGMQALIGGLPDIFKGLGDFFRNLWELIRVLSRLLIPAAEPGGGVGPGLPSAPAIPAGVRLQILLRQFSQDNIQDFLVFFLIPIIWALGRALQVFEDTFRLNSFRAVTENLMAGYFPLFRRNMAIIDASLVMDVTTIHPRRVGGPMRLEVDANSLAVMEPIQGAPELITATPGRIEVDAFERLHRIIDLRPYQIELEEELVTRDGMRVKLRQAHFGYRVRTTDEGVDLDAAQRMVYQHWLGKSWENPTARAQDTRRLVMRELAQFISDQKDLADLIPGAANLPEEPANPAIGQVLQEFADYFNALPGQFLQLTWEGDGAWELDGELFLPEYAETLLTSIENQTLRLELAQMVPGDLRRNEIQSMVQQILSVAGELDLNLVNPQTRITRLLAAYNAFMVNPPAGAVDQGA